MCIPFANDRHKKKSARTAPKRSKKASANSLYYIYLKHTDAALFAARVNYKSVLVALEIHGLIAPEKLHGIHYTDKAVCGIDVLGKAETL